MTSEYVFPDEFKSPKQKEQPAYGLQYVKAAYYSTNRYGMRLYDDQQFNFLIEIAQGRQSVDNLRKSFGFFNAGQNAGPNEANGALAFLDVQVLNLAPKYINRAVAKMQRFAYDIDLAVIDPISVDEAKTYEATIKGFYALKGWYEEMKLDPQQFFPDLDLAALPEYSDELMLNVTTNLKIRKAIDGQKTISLIHEINRMRQVMREWSWDCVVIGRGHLHVYLDENNVPRVDRVNPKYWGGAYCNNEDYSKQEYAFFVDFITINQFRKEAEGKLSDEQIQEAIMAHAYPAAEVTYSSILRDYNTFDGLKYIPVVRYYFLSNDHRAYERWDSQQGGPMLEERPYSYNNSNKKKATQQNGRMIKNTVTSVYGGSWVVNSEITYNYGRKAYPRTNLVNQTIPIVTFAPNQKDGRVVSMASQMTELLYMINVSWNRLKDILASGFKGVRELNFTAMESVALGKGGQVWTPRQVYEHMLQTRTLVTRQATSAYGQSMGPAITEGRMGIDMADYFSTITLCIKFLDDLTGSSVIESPNIPDRLSNGVMQQNIMAANESMEYLINGWEQVYKQSSHLLLLLAQEAKRNKATITGMIPALGKSTTEFFEIPDDIAYCEYGIYLTRTPTPEEWAEFYGEVSIALENGLINASDSAFIRDLKNLKEARRVLAIREESNKRLAIKERQAQEQFQSQMAEQSDARKLQIAQQVEIQAQANKKEMMMIQARIDDALLTKEYMLKGELEGVAQMVEERIKKQAGIDTIIKEALRSKSENYKTDKKYDADVERADSSERVALANNIGAHHTKVTTEAMKQQTAIETARLSAKKNPKTPVKKN